MTDVRTMPLRWGGHLEINDETGGIIIHGEIQGREVELTRIGLDQLLRFVGPACGIVPADWDKDGPGAKAKIDGPVCVGGPYDGRRIPRQSAPGGMIRVPVDDPIDISAWSESAAFTFAPRVGEYHLEPLAFGSRGYKHVFDTERWLWWWYSPEMLADYSRRNDEEWRNRVRDATKAESA